ncbi:transcriptional regulatory protein pro-1 [Fusarium mundagurra]|uniref:Transcriptional regulatory protein pro-1 n=1 Tax=Fusarium mundagurra TaxID=1567541 RepID=A0A8H5YBV5_9HYPO|nr:transcriptional regulatory protein pro-1 [Fusarium mundagurra]
MQRSEIRSRQGCLTCRKRHRKCDEKRPVCTLCQKSGRTCDYTNEFRWVPVSDVFVVADVSFNRGAKRVDRDERRRTAQNRGRQQRIRVRMQDAQQSDISGPVLNQCQNETETLDQGQSPSLGIAPYNDSQLQSGGSDHCDGFDSNWFNTFVMDQDLTTLSAQYNDHTPATSDSISEQLLLDPTIVHLDSVLSDGNASLEVTEIQHEVDGSKSTTSPVYGIIKNSELSLGPLVSSLPTYTEQIAFNYFMNHASPRIPALDSPGNPFLQRFAMIDVIMSLLRRREPLAPASFILYQQHEEAGVSGPSFRELTGCPQPVLSFLAKISILATDVELKNDARLAEAYQLETTMRNWGSRKYPMPLNIAARSNSSLSGHGTVSQDDHLSTLNACFYWMAHLLLARRVFMDPTASSRVQLYRKHLFFLIDRLPPGCGPDSSLPIPFYMAAREAILPLDREWVRQKHAEMLAIYPDRSRELMMSLTEDIWSMSDREPHDLVPKEPWDLPWMDDDMNIRMKDAQAIHFII